MRQRFTAEQWAKWFEEFDGSDSSIKAFCRRKGVSENTFYQWRKRLNHSTEPSTAGPFVPIAVMAEDEVKIEMPCGATIRVPNNPSSLRPVFETLLAIRASGS